MSAALLLATLLMTGLGQVAQKLTVEHWRLVAADGWTARLRSPWPWLALLALGSACSAGCCSCNGWKSAAPIRCWR